MGCCCLKGSPDHSNELNFSDKKERKDSCPDIKPETTP